MGILEQIDYHLEHPINIETRAKHFYPTSASVIDQKGNIIGACLRANAFEFWSIPKKPYTARTQWIFAMGKAVEDIIVGKLQEMGLYVARNQKFYNEYFGVSGELDIAVRESPGSDKIVGIECKSSNGPFFTSEVITGRKGEKPHPKVEHVLQVMLYLDSFIMPYFNLIYVDRGDVNRIEYKIELIEENGDKFPVITYPNRESYTDYRLSMAGVYDRYQTLRWHIKRDILPASDYKPIMTRAEVDKQLENKEISEAKYKKFANGETMTTMFQCQYCNWKDLCRGIDQKPIKKFTEKYKAGELKEYEYPKQKPV